MDRTRKNHSTIVYKHAGSTPDQVLAATLAALPEHQAKFEALFTAHPRAKAIAAGMAAYITNAIPVRVVRGVKAKQRVTEHHPASSLLTLCMRSGIEACRDGEDAFQAFLVGAFTHLPALATWQVYAGRSRSTRTWDFCSGPLHAWMSSHCSTPFVIQRPTIVHPPLDDQAVRTFIASRLLAPEDFDLIAYKIQNVLPPHQKIETVQ